MYVVESRHYQAWVGDIPDEMQYTSDRFLEWHVEDMPTLYKLSTLSGIQFSSQPSDTESFIMIGGSFVPDSSGQLVIKVAVSNESEGLTEEYAQIVFESLIASAYIDIRSQSGAGVMLIDHAAIHPISMLSGILRASTQKLYRLLNPCLHGEGERKIQSILCGGLYLDGKVLPGAIKAALCPLPNVSKHGRNILLDWVTNELIGWFSDEYKAYVRSSPPDVTQSDGQELSIDEALELIDKGSVFEKETAYWTILSSKDETLIRGLLAKTGWVESTDKGG